MSSFAPPAPLVPAQKTANRYSFSDTEIEDFNDRAAERDRAGRGWNELFTQGDRISLKLVSDESPKGLDERLDTILKEHNSAAEQVYASATEEEKKIARIELCTFAHHPSDRTLLKRFLGGKPKSEKKLIEFLQSKDDAECHLLAHDLTVEWGKAKDTPAEKAEAGTNRDFALVQNTKPLAADQFAPDSLRVVISRDPIDIARMSTGRRWTSCMAKGDSNYDYVPEEIEAGTLVAYLTDKDDKEIDYPLARVLLKPFHNVKGETILVPNFVYASNLAGNSQMEAALLGTVRGFVRNHVNHGKTGQFKMAEGIFSDGQETGVTLGQSAIDVKAMGNAIADAVLGKAIEHLTEIKAAHNAGNQALKQQHEKQLQLLYRRDADAAAITYLRSLRDMNISQMLPKPSQVKEAYKSPAVQQAYTTLNVRGNKIGAEGAKALAENKTLTTLHVGSNNIGDEGAEALAANTTLTTLNVSDNKISAEGAKALAANKTLTSLDVSYNNIGAEGIKALAANTTLTTLNVSDNKISAEGATALAANTTITSLNLWCNLIRDEGAKALAANKTLTLLDVGGNNIGAEGAKALAANQTLTTLHVGANNIGDEGAKALAANTTLTSLYVMGNNIGDEGAKALAANKTLATLSVMGNNIGYEGAMALAANTTLTLLVLGNTKIRNEGARALVSGLLKSKNILYCPIKFERFVTPEQSVLSDQLDRHVTYNHKKAEEYAKTLSSGSVFSEEDQKEIRARANAIRYVIGENKDLTAEQKQTALKNLDAVVKTQSRVDRTEKRTPRELG